MFCSSSPIPSPISSFLRSTYTLSLSCLSLSPTLLLSLSFSPGTRPQASASATRPSITSTSVSGTLSRRPWPQSARTCPAGTISHWRYEKPAGTLSLSLSLCNDTCAVCIIGNDLFVSKFLSIPFFFLSPLILSFYLILSSLLPVSLSSPLILSALPCLSPCLCP